MSRMQPAVGVGSSQDAGEEGKGEASELKRVEEHHQSAAELLNACSSRD